MSLVAPVCSTRPATGCQLRHNRRCLTPVWLLQRSSRPSARQADQPGQQPRRRASIHSKSAARNQVPRLGSRPADPLDSPLPLSKHPLAGQRWRVWRLAPPGQATEPEQCRAVAFAGPSESARVLSLRVNAAPLRSGSRISTLPGLLSPRALATATSRRLGAETTATAPALCGSRRWREKFRHWRQTADPGPRVGGQVTP